MTRTTLAARMRPLSSYLAIAGCILGCSSRTTGGTGAARFVVGNWICEGATLGQQDGGTAPSSVGVNITDDGFGTLRIRFDDGSGAALPSGLRWPSNGLRCAELVR